MLYQVTGHVHIELDEHTAEIQLPTFFLDSDIQGIVDAEHAKRIAGTMIQSVMTAPSAVFLDVIERDISQVPYEVVAAAVRDSRPISQDMTNDSVRAAHTQLDMFVHNFVDREANLNPSINRARLCEATGTPLNRFDR